MNAHIRKGKLTQLSYHVARPPLKSNTCPVVKLQAGEAINAAMWAISSGVQNLPFGIRLFLSAIYESLIPSNNSVTAIEGAIQLTVISDGKSSLDNPLAKPITPA